ncbi:DNA adenine methylase [Sphingomonas cavernae]|uniref:site-specific DNA-methyltransferase (adenine-specific) n=1 Tax=Sphingomonas cavernae TaxID=2320861 RepID=A0A418WP38_9SPHN|nr:DNA adenine methylase [Sphingomonas cavernae]RJF92989.1 DNA adenine methylase [Sphingomonas cavernae]
MKSSPKMSPVQPVRPVAPYIGGKRALAKRLTALIDAIPHDTYVEPFIGMGGIFLRRRMRPKAEVINDISLDVTTLFLILQEHYGYFVDHLRFRITGRAEFERLASIDPQRTRMTDLNRAARFLYLQRTAFGGKVSGRHFGVDPRSAGRFNVSQLEPMLADLHERLAGVIIECLPYAELIARYDRPGTLFYLDPPYFGCERDYGAGVFDRADFETMAAQLATIRGRFVLSINDHPEIRRVFAGFHLIEVQTTRFDRDEEQARGRADHNQHRGSGADRRQRSGMTL